jgi:transposase
MNQGKYVFSQLIEFLSHNEFNCCVNKYKGNYKIKTFSCWHQMLYMIFGQLSNRESLSDLIVCLSSQANKSYHLGMGSGTSKANLAKANENRDYRIYEAFASFLVAQAQGLGIVAESFKLNIQAPVYAIDATVIDLCLNLFWWGKFRKHKAAVKLHTMFDVKTNIPTMILITGGAIHEVNLLDSFPVEEGSYYLLDKGYIEFEKLHRIHKSSAYFVMPAKENFAFVRLVSRKVDRASGIICDQTVRLKNKVVSLKYPQAFRRVKCRDTETNTEIVILTNNFDLSAQEVGELYRYRWDIEVFFRWIKQHLKVKTFWGHSFNAVKTQIYIAMITYLLVAIVKHQLRIKQSQYEILQILSISLLCKIPLTELFSNTNQQYFKEQEAKQLNIFI